MSTVVDIKEVLFDGKIYPREKPSSSIIGEYADALASGAKFPPIILESGTGRLLDGYHRWKAHIKLVEEPSLFSLNGESANYAAIEAVYHDVPQGITPKLYAYFLSSNNGLRPSRADAKMVAEEQYEKMPGTPMTTFARYLGVTDKTAKSYVEHLVAEFEENKRTIMARLSLLGWTQDEISNKLKNLYPDADGTSRSVFQNFSHDFGDLRNHAKNDFDRGHKVSNIAQSHRLPQVLTWAMVLDDAEDEARLKQLGINLQPYDVWQFPRCHDLFGSKHPGRIPGEMIAHVLYFYTQQGDVIIDPMVGSGTTLDVCLAMGRKCYGFDIDQRHERPDVIEHNIAVDGWHERVKKADMIFWDPPYFEKMDSGTIGADGYIEGSISKLPRDEYLQFFSQQLTEAAQLVKPGTRLAFLMSDWDDETGEREGVFVWDYANIITDAGWKLKRHIQAPLSTQQVHPDIVNKFRKSRRLARLERYLLIAEV